MSPHQRAAASPRWRPSPGRRTRRSCSRSAQSCSAGTARSASGRSAASVTSRSSSTPPNTPTAFWWDESRCSGCAPITPSRSPWSSSPWTPPPTRSSGRPLTTQVKWRHRSNIGSPPPRVGWFTRGLFDCAITQYLCVFKESDSLTKRHIIPTASLVSCVKKNKTVSLI